MGLKGHDKFASAHRIEMHRTIQHAHADVGTIWRDVETEGCRGEGGVPLHLAAGYVCQD